MDWLEGYLELTEGLPTPPLFRLWAGIAALACTGERRVWLSTLNQVLYPNLYIVLVGVPGSGKSQAIKPAQRLLTSSKKINIAPTDMTKAALVDVFKASVKKVLINGETVEFHPLSVILSEFGTLVSAYDLDLMNLINVAFDNEDVSSQRRGHNEGKLIMLKNANMNILAGTQPGYLSEVFPDVAWTMGFASRLIMIYGSEAPQIDPFTQAEDRGKLFGMLRDQLVTLTGLSGPFTIEEDAKLFFRHWNASGLAPKPDHVRLAHYTSRRLQYALKLAMIASLSRGTSRRIALGDVERAKSWLVSAEALMPDIFRDMEQKSDRVLMNEVHRYALAMWTKSSPRDPTKREPLTKSQLMRFLAQRCPAFVAEKVLDVMVSADWLSQDPTNPHLYLPRVRGFMTLE